MKDFLLFNLLATIGEDSVAGIQQEMQELYFLPNALAKLTNKEKESIVLVGKDLKDPTLQRMREICKDNKWHKLKKLNLSENSL